MKRASELRLHCPAQSQHVALIRHALAAFLEALQYDRGMRDDVTTAAGEALANVVEHAYAGCSSTTAGDVALLARLDHHGTLSVDVSDRGAFIRRKALPGRGFGLRIIRAVARRLQIDTTRGTCVSMTFEGPAAADKR